MGSDFTSESSPFDGLPLPSLSGLERLKLRSKPFPLKSLLLLYYTAQPRDVYINYFEGFKLLVAWLGPIDSSEAEKFPKHMYRYSITYEIQEIAKILNIPMHEIYWTLRGIYYP